MRGCRTRQPMPLMESVTATEWQKWQRYRRLPWKLCVDATVLLAAITLLLLVVSQTAQYANASADTLENVFGLPGTGGTTRLYTTDDLRASVTRFLDAYWNLPNATLSRLWHVRDAAAAGGIARPQLLLTTFQQGLGVWDFASGEYNVPDSLDTQTTAYYLSRADGLGPLSDGNGGVNTTLLHRTHSVQLAISFVSLNVGVLGGNPYSWSVKATYVFTGGGMALLKLTSAKTMLRSSIPESLSEVLVSTFLLLSCLLSMCTWALKRNVLHLTPAVLGARALYRGYLNQQTVMVRVAQLPRDSQYDKFRTVPWGMRLEFFDLWNVFNGIGCLLLVVACVLLVLRPLVGIGDAHWDLVCSLFLGMGTWFACVNFLRHFQLSRRLSLLVSTLRLALYNIVVFLLSLLPLFGGFVFLAVSLFSQYSNRFASVDTAAVSLFALMGGDDIHATFDEVEAACGVFCFNLFFCHSNSLTRVQMTAELPSNYLWISRIYLYLYVLLSLTAILNIFIFLTEDAFHVAKHFDRASTRVGSTHGGNFTLRELITVLESVEGRALHESDMSRKGTARYQPLVSDDGDNAAAADDAGLINDSNDNELRPSEDEDHHARADEEELERMLLHVQQRMQETLVQELAAVKRDWLARVPIRHHQ